SRALRDDPGGGSSRALGRQRPALALHRGHGSSGEADHRPMLRGRAAASRPPSHGVPHPELQRGQDGARPHRGGGRLSLHQGLPRAERRLRARPPLQAERRAHPPAVRGRVDHVAHLAAAALGYAVWWITAIGQEDIQRKIKPLLGVPNELAVIDVMCFGPPLKPSYKRWKKRLDQIMSWERFDPRDFLTEAEIDEWVRTTRHKVMYRDESKID